VLLQHLIEVEGVLGARGEGVRPGKVILPDCLGLGALGVMLYAHPPEVTVGGCEPILPHDDGTFPLVQLLLLGMELLL
jgi:hypothetical protein